MTLSKKRLPEIGAGSLRAPLKTHWLGVMVLSLLLSACSQPAENEKRELAVRTTIIKSASAQGGLILSGTVVPRVEGQMAFRVPGHVVKRVVDVGDQVVRGAVLAELDRIPFQLAVEEAEAQLAQAQATLAQVGRDVLRNRQLVQAGAVARADFDVLETTEVNAQAQVRAARSRLAQARNNLTYTTLLAPVDGTVAAVQSEAGQVVEAGTPVMVIAYDGPREVQVDVPEAHVAAIRPGDKVHIKLLSDTAAELTGSVREIASVADPATRTYRLRVVLDGLRNLARLGMTASVRFAMPSMATEVRLPLTALFQRGEQPAVWILPEQAHQVTLRPVKVASLDTDSFTVTEGLQVGERVVTAGVHRLDEEQIVRIWDERLP